MASKNASSVGNSHVLFIPIKTESKRVPRKNFALVNGKPLYQIFPMTCKEAGVFTDIVIDSDSEEIIMWAIANGFRYLHRVPSMATDTANGNTLLRYHASRIPTADYFWQGFVTTPFITASTVYDMVTRLDRCSEHGVFDSIMTVTEVRGFLWNDERKPINHRPDVMPRSQDLPSVYMERHGLFGISRESFDITLCRAGLKPYPYVLSKEEDQDIDWPEDLQAVQQAHHLIQTAEPSVKGCY